MKRGKRREDSGNERYPEVQRKYMCSGPAERGQVGDKSWPREGRLPKAPEMKEGQGFSFSSEYANVKQVGTAFEPKEQNFL